jgi:hypothetical protein
MIGRARQARCALPIALAALMLLAPAALGAHIGSPDVFVDAMAGPYHLYVTVRPPTVIPGVAEIDIFAPDGDVDAVKLVPSPLTGPAAALTPTPDRAVRADDDPHRFSGHLWMMTAGAWQVRVMAEGAHGSGEAAVPVPTLPQATKTMDAPLGMLLAALTLLLAAGIVVIAAAMAREAALEPGAVPGPRERRRGRIAGAIAAAVVVLILVLGNRWWSAEASAYSRYVYKPLAASTALDGSRLTLTLRDPGWISLRTLDDLVPDHGHVMHFFVVSPDLDRFWHLHPRQTGPGVFVDQLPDLPAGRYEFFADVVHATGISETAAGSLATADVPGTPLAGDDSAWAGRAATDAMSPLPDGARMIRVGGAQPVRAGELSLFTFRVEDAQGRPAGDLELYMGMPGHAVFISRDRQVFAHVHPSGSAPMAAMALAAKSLAPAAPAAGPMSSMDMSAHAALPATVSFPFGLPKPGAYRVFVQIKRHGEIQTGVFEVKAE